MPVSYTHLEIVQKALKLGISELGFSGHASMLPLPGNDTFYCMTAENTIEYRKEISQLKKNFSDKIKIFCGIEKMCIRDRYSTAHKTYQ